MTITVAFEELADLRGTELGASSWLDVDQAMIDRFAAATGDDQWIHTDPDKAATGPFGGTIAHGYLTLSLVIPLWTELLDVTGVNTKVNYGLNKVRFPAPVPSGAAVRLVAKLDEVESVAAGGVQLTADVVVEVQDQNRPACVAQPVFRFYP